MDNFPPYSNRTLHVFLGALRNPDAAVFNRALSIVLSNTENPKVIREGLKLLNGRFDMAAAGCNFGEIALLGKSLEHKCYSLRKKGTVRVCEKYLENLKKTLFGLILNATCTQNYAEAQTLYWLQDPVDPKQSLELLKVVRNQIDIGAGKFVGNTSVFALASTVIQRSAYRMPDLNDEDRNTYINTAFNIVRHAKENPAAILYGHAISRQLKDYIPSDHTSSKRLARKLYAQTRQRPRNTTALMLDALQAANKEVQPTAQQLQF